MNTAVALQNDNTASMDVGHLLLELDRYRRHSEWLALVNNLHGRLAGVLDLPGMLDAFSVWLMPLAGHDLIAFHSVCGTRAHMTCSCHGPERREVFTAAEKVVSTLLDLPADYAEPHTKIYMSENGYYVHKWIVKLDDGDGHIILLCKENSFNSREVRVISKALAVFAEPLQRALDYENLYEQASRDTLTGLENRRVFEQRIDSLIAQARRHGSALTLVSMDLDKFKQVNDSLGHAAGDKVLQRVAQTLTTLVRDSDLLLRMGGDEFTLVLPDTDAKAAQKLAERLCHAVEQLDIVIPDGGKVGISIGLVQWHNSTTLAEWLLRADEALYQAKANGRSRVHIHDCPAGNQKTEVRGQRPSAPTLNLGNLEKSGFRPNSPNSSLQ